MSNDTTNYDQSPTPPSKPGGIAIERDTDSAITVDDNGGLQYASAASEGRIEIVMPSLPGSPNAETRMHAKDFGAFVTGQIESSLARNPYLKSGAQQRPDQVFSHFVSVAAASKLLDDRTLRNAQQLAKEFQDEPDRREFFETTIRPWLNSLNPKRR